MTTKVKFNQRLYGPGTFSISTYAFWVRQMGCRSTFIMQNIPTYLPTEPLVDTSCPRHGYLACFNVTYPRGPVRSSWGGPVWCALCGFINVSEWRELSLNMPDILPWIYWIKYPSILWICPTCNMSDWLTVEYCDMDSQRHAHPLIWFTVRRG